MKKDKILANITIETLGYGWVGIAKTEDGKTILIKGGLPGSIVDIKIVRQKKDYIEGHITLVHSVPPALLTGELKCPHYLYEYAPLQWNLPKYKTGCGGCKRQIIAYPQQLELKHSIVTDCFAKLLQTHPSLTIKPVLWSPKIFGYRNKIEFSFGKYIQQEKKNDDPSLRSEGIQEHRLAGFHKQWAFEKVVDVDQCYLISQSMHEVYSYLKDLLQKSWLPVHDVKHHNGFLRHLVLREGLRTGQLLVNLVVSTKYFAIVTSHKKIREQLQETMLHDHFLQEHITSLVITDNNGLADVVKASEYTQKILRWEGIYLEELHLTYQQKTNISRRRVSPFSFFQTNTLGAECLFSTALSMLWSVTGNIIDLYCGSGTIGLSFLKAGMWKSVKGIEIVAEAVEDAYFNARINSLADRADFYAGKAEDLLKQGIINESFFIGNDLIIVDPPREGLHPSVINFLHTLKQKYMFKLLYISCNPLTMARDIQMLQDLSPRHISSIQPVDMFPHTHHIECIIVLS